MKRILRVVSTAILLVLVFGVALPAIFTLTTPEFALLLGGALILLVVAQIAWLKEMEGNP